MARAEYSNRFYCPQRSCGKVMLLHLTVILFTEEGGVWQTPSPGQTSSLGRRPPLGKHPPPETATAADGTHPTGTHSCF